MKIAAQETPTTLTNVRRLGEMKPGQKGVIVSTAGDDAVQQRLLEMGMLEGATVEVIHEAPISRDPIAVRVRGTLIALRRHEANRITLHYSEPTPAQTRD